MRKGFTLVELSIVLVIIGLLIGGILVAQSMVNTSRIQAQVRQIQQIEIAVTNFQTKYNSLPGDTNVFTPAGDKDGYLEYTPNQTSATDQFNGEAANFWPQLQQGVGFDPQNNYTATVTGTFNSIKSALNAPVSVLNPDGSFKVYSYASLGIKNMYHISNTQLITNGSRCVWQPWCGYPGNNNAIKTQDLLAIDAKIDDGAFDGSYTGNLTEIFNYSTNARACVSTDDMCMVFIKMQSQTTQER